MAVYTETIPELILELDTNEATGLTQEEADKRLEEYGENRLVAAKKRGIILKFLDQLKDVMVIILLIAAAISFALAIIEGHEFIDSIIILAIVILNAILGVVQESNAEKALDALKDMSAPSATIIRDGKSTKIESRKLVPGDILIVEAGDLVPADARLIECASIKSEESALTGESVPVDKNINVQIAENAPLGDRLNMLYSGCSITYGRGKAVITGTGMSTEMGKIADLLNRESANELTPLQNRLNKMGKYLGFLALLICAVIFAIGMLDSRRDTDVVEMFMTAVSLAVAAIPEGLTTVVTLVLAMGVQRMSKENAIVRRLPAVETLGSTSVICSDKTGTLTQNKMTVQKLWVAGEELTPLSSELDNNARRLIKYGALCNDGSVIKDDEGKEKHFGDPTETAIVAAAITAGMNMDDMRTEYPRISEIPFDSDRKLMTTVHKRGEATNLVIVKGGFDVMLPLCIDGDRSRAEEINLTLGKDALRVLAIGFKYTDDEGCSDVSCANLESGLTFLGLIGMIDPPREESKAAIATCFNAGIKTVMITGDHIVTASAIAKELGILKDDSEAISGTELALLSEEELIKNVRNYSVYARVSPEDKIRIVKAWQTNGEIVAMTGDGVNDAPALKAADIGCAMGITGTEVAKGAADMVLTDDNFSTIVTSVEEGRTIYDNIKKTISFLLGSNIGEVVVVFVAMLMGWGVPLVAIQLLMINVVTDAFPAFALGFEKGDKNIMRRKPIPKDEGIFAGGLGLKIVLQGLMIASLTLIAFYIGSFVPAFGPPSEATGRTMAFLTLAITQLVQAFNCRSDESLFKAGFFSNMYMIGAFFLSLAITLAITLVPFLEKIFGMVDLSQAQWLVIVALCVATFVIVEIAKAITSGSRKRRLNA